MNPWTSTTTLALGVVLFIAACATAPTGGPASTVSAPGTASAPATTQVQLVDGMTSIPTRPGVRQPFRLATPKAAPVATVILLPGDDGQVFALSENFLVRSQHMFVDEGFLVAILDTPSDRTSLARVSSDHAHDVGTLIAALRAAAPVPVWLIGTSMGTISAVSVASQLDTGGPDGIVLTSTVQQALNAGVDRVRVPTLVVHNKYDSCPVSPYSVGALAARSISQSPRHELLTFSSTRGGSSSYPCQALSPHGYLGIEGDVVHAIAEWIKAPR
jgi:pimeloyl-ACP methyl ester carboxylesterase